MSLLYDNVSYDIYTRPLLAGGRAYEHVDTQRAIRVRPNLLDIRAAGHQPLPNGFIDRASSLLSHAYIDLHSPRAVCITDGSHSVQGRPEDFIICMHTCGLDGLDVMHAHAN